MKNIILTTFLVFLLILNLQAQTFSLKQVDEAPVIEDCEFVEGNKECFEESLKVHVQKTMDIRKLNLGEDGKAYAQFEITEEGMIENVRVRATDEKLKKETRRIIEEIKIKEPAHKDGKPVTLLHTIPVTFNNIMVGRDSKKGNDISLAYKDADQPPVFKECLSSEEKNECFKSSAEQKIRSFLSNNANLKDLIKKGDIIKVYFEVAANSEVKNPLVVFENFKVRNSLISFLGTFKFEKPAMSNKNRPVKIYYQENLVF